MSFRIGWLGGLLLTLSLLQAEEQKLPTLKVGSEVYSNVTITSITATDIYFSHSGGLGNAKLKKLDAELQKKFRFDPAKASAKEQQQAESQALYNKAVREAKPSQQITANEIEETDPGAAGEEMPAHGITANSFLNQPAPTIIVQKWLTDEPDLTGKFVIVDFWATWCAPCKRSIPELNALYSRFKDRLVIMGLSNEPEETVRAMTSPQIDYSVGIDPQQRSLRIVGVRGIPHALLVDPKGVVRFEGHPSYLTAEALEKIMNKYAE